MFGQFFIISNYFVRLNHLIQLIYFAFMTYQSSPMVLTGRPPQTLHILTSAAEQQHIPEKTKSWTLENRSHKHSHTCSRRAKLTSRMMKNSSPGSPCTTIFWVSSNCTGSKASATVRRSHLSRDSVMIRQVHVTDAKNRLKPIISQLVSIRINKLFINIYALSKYYLKWILWLGTPHTSSSSSKCCPKIKINPYQCFRIWGEIFPGI